MAWVYVDDQFPDHPKVARAGGDAAWLYVCGLAYCKRYSTDGTIPKAQIARLSDRKTPERLAKLLVEVCLWHDDGDCYRVHDYEEWNKSGASRSEAGRKAAQARWSKRCDDDANADANAYADASDRIMRNGESVDASGCTIPFPYPFPSSVRSSDSSDAAPSSPPKAPRGSRLPDEFFVSDEMRVWVTAECPSVDWREQTARFCDFWRGKPGKDGVKADWPATWRNWMRRARDDAPKADRPRVVEV